MRDVDVPRHTEPGPDIVKNATEANYDSRRRRHPLHDHRDQYGNTTLAAVTVTDPNAAGLGCASRPTARRLRPAPISNCTAHHTITQADIDAGHYLNTACVDDGRAAPPRTATTRTSRRTRTRISAIVKDATESSYDSVGDVIHYTIVATNDG